MSMTMMSPDHSRQEYFHSVLVTTMNQGIYALRGSSSGGGGGSEDRSSSFSWSAASSWMPDIAGGTLQSSFLSWRDHNSDPNHRHLKGESRGQAVLTFMYLCVLGLCFTTAVIYFCRMQWEERYLRQVREFERQQIRSAMAQSINGSGDSNGGNGESQAVQRKYVEERRARILQLFAPVRMTLEPGHFADKGETTIATTNAGISNKTENDSQAADASAASAEKREETTKNQDASESSDNNRTTVSTKDATTTTHNNETEVASAVVGETTSEYAYGEDESLMVEIPVPGLHLCLNIQHERPPTRWVSGMCTICLCCLEVGSDVVWSSNELCEHVFHEACIEKWLMKQREGPLCPCCRRDFIVDPYDMTENNNNDNNENSGVAGGNRQPNNDVLYEDDDVEAATSAGVLDTEEATTRP